MPAKDRRDGSSRLRIYAMHRALTKFGWQSFVLPWKLTLSQRRRLLAAFDPDVILMQGARHPLNRPEHYRGIPVVYDLDDADFHLSHLAAPVRAAMPHVSAVAAGSSYIADWCRQNGAGGAVEVIWTSTSPSRAPAASHDIRGPVVVWAQSRPMNYHDEARLVRAVMARVAEVRPGTVLRIFDRRAGDDPAFASGFASEGLSVEWADAASYDAYLALLDDVAVGLAPLVFDDPFHRGKSFGKILAYLDRRVPTVFSSQGEPVDFFTPRTGVSASNIHEWVGAIVRLLDDASLRQEIADAAHDEMLARLHLRVSASRLDGLLRRVIAA